MTDVDRGTFCRFGKTLMVTAFASGGIIAATSTASFAQNNERITVAIAEDIRGMDPRRDRDGMSDDVHMHIVEGLVGFTDALEVEPLLAESVSVEDGGKTYVFELRDNVVFHNGEPMTSAEVKWSWNYLMADDSIWRCKAVFDGPIKVASVETPDAMTVVYNLAEPNGSFLANLARPDCAGTPVLHPDSVDADGNWKRVIGTGPFTLGERRVGQYTEVNRFADYAADDAEPSGMVGRKEPMVDTIRFVVVADPAARTVGLRSGDLDIAPITTQMVEQIEADSNLHVSSSPTTVWYSLLLGMDDPLLKDVRMRRAIAAAIDADAVARGVSFGQWPGSATPMPRASTLYNAPPAEHRKASPEKAKALLAEAGYSGEPITLLATKAYPLMFDQAVIIQSMLQAVGINATIETLEWGLQLERYTTGDYQAQSFGYSGRFDPLGAWERIIGPESRKVWKDEEAIALLAKGMESTDPKQRKEVSNQLYSMFVEQVPAVSLYHVQVSYGVNDRLEGFEASPLEAARLWNVSVE